MKTTRPLGIGIGVAVALSATYLSAQSPSSTMSREVVSATGCLRLAGGEGQGEGLGTALVLKGVRIAPSVGLVEAPRTAPVTPPSAREGSPVVDPGSAALPPATRESGADAAPPEPRPDPGLLLVADRGVDLATHVGHRVLVTGRLSSFAAPGGEASTSSGRTLTVTSVSLISPACTTGS
jgi:hypothetical protein